MRNAFKILSLLLFLAITSSFSVTRKAPAGTHAVQGLTNTFLDKMEVTNGAWREFLRKLSTRGDSTAYRNALPDLAVWEMAYHGNFLEIEAYDQYPVVGMNFQQAKAYCGWRSEIISAKEKRRITFSLPSMKVYKLTLIPQDANKTAEGLYSTQLGFRTFLGLCDNAAEMTDTEGSAISGAEREECLETYWYYSPSARLGFRCMAKLN